MQAFSSEIAKLSDLSFPTLVGVLLSYMVLRGLVFQGAQALLSRWSRLRRRTIIAIRPSAAETRRIRQRELRGNMVAILTATVFFAVALRLGLAPNNTDRNWVPLVLYIIWWESWFYVLHRALHSKKLYFIHRQHHSARTNTPLTAMSFSALETLLLLGGGWAPLMIFHPWIPVSHTAVALYSLLNYVAAVYQHFNSELIPSGFLRIPGFSTLVVTPTYHALHHHRYQGNFGLLTPVYDHLFGTTFLDYEKVQERAFSGGLPAVDTQEAA